MGNTIKVVVSWLIALWTSNVFINSLFFKFNEAALEPKHIFNTIGTWMSDTISPALGGLFTEYGAITVGVAELLTAIALLAPVVLWKYRQKLHLIGGLMATTVMTGAIFFHLFTPLGWEPTWIVSSKDACQAIFVAPNSCMDTGLANAALSILVLNIIMIVINRKSN